MAMYDYNNVGPDINVLLSKNKPDAGCNTLGHLLDDGRTGVVVRTCLARFGDHE